MKRSIIILLLVFLSGIIFSQNQEMVSIPKDQLTSEQIRLVEKNNQIEKVRQYGEWVGIGNEIGLAVRESLMGVVDVADKFGNTDVGKITIGLVIWEILGESLIRILFAIIFIIISTILVFRIYRNLFTIRKLRTKGVWWQFWNQSEFKYIEPDKDWDGYVGMQIILVILYMACLGIAMAISFA